jgi:very-short-patch-repair endonuclease
MVKIKCIECSKEFKTDGKLKDHWNRKHKEKNFRDFHPLKCKYCDAVFISNGSLGGHTINCEKNPRKVEIALSKAKKNRESNTGKVLTKEHKEKISIGRTKYLQENPDKVPYRLNHSSKDSYPELLFEKGLTEIGIKGWCKDFPFGIYEFDFAFPDLKIDIEVDGDTHNQEKVKLIDEKRDKLSKEKGWIVLRFKTKEVRNNLKNCIEKVLEKIKERESNFDFSLLSLDKIYNKSEFKKSREESRKKGKCIDCLLPIFLSCKRCSDCYAKKQGEHLPTKEKLEELLKNNNLTQIGKMYSVKGNSVKKWCKKYNLKCGKELKESRV